MKKTAVETPAFLKWGRGAPILVKQNPRRKKGKGKLLKTASQKKKSPRRRRGGKFKR